MRRQRQYQRHRRSEERGSYRIAFIIQRGKRVPLISIIYDTGDREYLARYVEEISYGIEEEGLMFNIASTEAENIFEAAIGSAQSSATGAAVGIGKDFIVIMDKKAKDKRPVLLYNGCDPYLCRIAGQNAARLAKCKPFLL